MCHKEHCYLQPFCYFTQKRWQNIVHEYDEVRACILSWDFTDYVRGDFDKFGFSLITISNWSISALVIQSGAQRSRRIRSLMPATEDTDPSTALLRRFAQDDRYQD